MPSPTPTAQARTGVYDWHRKRPWITKVGLYSDSVRLVIWKVKFAPLEPGPGPWTQTICNFLLSAQPLQLQARMEREVCDPTSCPLPHSPSETLSSLIYYLGRQGWKPGGNSAKETGIPGLDLGILPPTLWWASLFQLQIHYHGQPISVNFSINNSTRKA